MKILHSLKGLKKERRPVVLAAGFFDGLHRGHRKVIDGAIKMAGGMGGSAWVVTFDPHPMKVLHPELAPQMLTAHPHKLKLLAGMGVDGCLVIPFTRRLAGLEPAEFAGQLLKCVPPLAGVVVGVNWRFGRKGKGDPALLARLCRGLGLKIKVVKPMLLGGEFISSTRIRDAVAKGDLTGAARMLGRPYSLLGTVVHGLGLGRKLGFPTANLDPHNEVIPASGIYAVTALIGRRLFDGVVNIGFRPTIRIKHAHKPLVELHIFDFKRDIYGKNIEVFFKARLRDEEKFATLEELKIQIAADIAAARRVLAGTHSKLPPVTEQQVRGPFRRG